MRFVYSLAGATVSLLSLSVAAATLPDAGQSQQNIDQP
ncbi:hypothetical protein SAMN05216600_113126 [Pseudomonas cuatrocienegasensis]|uniref:Uncharacterized protein n=1 Tax=Pseudomonas cuatrocienegasensis TaxID=543360 RepID=A0ABY1BK02_9PSED|nr:hypothetical protein SAMN05216600_113126 [Pseudomonas cuatrocienegasensis]